MNQSPPPPNPINLAQIDLAVPVVVGCCSGATRTASEIRVGHIQVHAGQAAAKAVVGLYLGATQQLLDAQPVRLPFADLSPEARAGLALVARELLAAAQAAGQLAAGVVK